jgi:hypothetical protein
VNEAISLGGGTLDDQRQSHNENGKFVHLGISGE